MTAKLSYHPKSDHPWRRYKNRRDKNEEDTGEDAQEKRISLKEFLVNLVDAWDTYQIPSPNITEREYVHLSKLSPEKQAEWIIKFIKKHWLSGSSEPILFE